MRAKLIKEAMTDAKRLVAADNAFKSGDVETASLLWSRLAISRTKNPASLTAKERMAGLQEHGRKQLAEANAGLPGGDALTSTGDILLAASGDAAAITRKKQIGEAFVRYEDFARQYDKVPVVGREITRELGQQERRLKYEVVLAEPEARQLWETAESLRLKDQLCCAYTVYEQAARLGAAPSSQLARDRLAQLNRDPEVVASAKACLEVQWCHEAYVRAERLIEVRPEKAVEIFGEIVNRAPEDSPVYQEARKQIHELSAKS